MTAAPWGLPFVIHAAVFISAPRDCSFWTDASLILDTAIGVHGGASKTMHVLVVIAALAFLASLSSYQLCRHVIDTVFPSQHMVCATFASAAVCLCSESAAEAYVSQTMC